jgi:hypothetical protein
VLDIVVVDMEIRKVGVLGRMLEIVMVELGELEKVLEAVDNCLVKKDLGNLKVMFWTQKKSLK